MKEEEKNEGHGEEEEKKEESAESSVIDEEEEMDEIMDAPAWTRRPEPKKEKRVKTGKTIS